MSDVESRSECLALVERSPAAVKAHDKQAWLAIFSSSAVVEDPVGSRPHCNELAHGRATGGSLDRFYETFIAANDVRFHVDRDIVCGQQVMRDLTLEIRMSPQVIVKVPAHLLYELVEVDGCLKVSRLAAHWELGPMLRQQLVPSLAYLKVGMASFLRMLRYLGVRGVAGFMRGFDSVGVKGKERTAAFARDFNRQVDISRFFSSDAPSIWFPVGEETLTVRQLAETGGTMRLDKVLAAGNVVTASCRYESVSGTIEGVILIQFERSGLLINTLSFYGE